MGRARRAPMPSVDAAVRPPARPVSVYAGCLQHFELHTAPDRIAGREDVSDGVAHDAGADNGEPAVGPQKEPLQGERAAKTDGLRR